MFRILFSLSAWVYKQTQTALSTAFMAFLGIYSIFIFDLLSFATAFIVMLIYIPLPHDCAHTAKEFSLKSFFTDYKEGFIFLKKHQALLHLILFFTAINLIAYIGGGGFTTAVDYLSLYVICHFS